MLGCGAAVGDVGAAGTLWDCRHCNPVRASRSALCRQYSLRRCRPSRLL